MKSVKKKIIRFFVLVLLLYLLNVGLVYNHESIHKTVFKYYGVSSEIRFKSGLLGGETVPNFGQLDGLEPDVRKSLDGWNLLTEQIDYRLNPLLLFLFGSWFLQGWKK